MIIKQRGMASWYGHHWQGRRTASGVRFDDQALTAANLWLPLPTHARVTNLANGRSVEVVVNDRGPYAKGRIIDLSARAAQVIGMKRSGVAPVVVEAVLPKKPAVLPANTAVLPVSAAASVPTAKPAVLAGTPNAPAVEKAPVAKTKLLAGTPKVIMRLAMR